MPSPVRAKRIDIPVDSRCAACRPRLTAAQGPRVEQRAILARTFRKSRSKAKAPRAACHVPSQGQELRSQLLIDRLRPTTDVTERTEIVLGYNVIAASGPVVPASLAIIQACTTRQRRNPSDRSVPRSVRSIAVTMG